MLQTNFQESKPSGSEKEGFFNIFLCISMARTYDPGQRPSWTLGPSIRTNLVEVHFAMLHTKFQTSGPCGSEKEGF